MKPRTKEEREIVAISNKMKPLPEWRVMEARQAGAVLVQNKKDCWCSACGSVILPGDVGRKCPVCGSVITGELEASKKRVIYDTYYYNVITTSGKWQIIRYFLAKRYVKKATLTKPCIDFDLNEVCRIFISDKAKKYAVARPRVYNGLYFDSWSINGPLELRTYNEDYERLAGFPGSRAKLLPVIHRNGLHKINQECGELSQILDVMHDAKMETIAKCGDRHLFAYCSNNKYRIMSFWPAIKQAMKHKHKFKSYEDVRLWNDYLLMLEHNHKDWHNPKIAIPEDITKVHDELVKKQVIISQKKAEKERRERMIQYEQLNEEYIQKFESIMNIEVYESNICLKILQDIEDFSEEAKVLHHCVFKAEYFNIHKYPDSVIVGAKVNGKRTETIEINYKSRQIIQCQGLFNQNSEYHDEILTLITKNINKFIPKSL